MPGEYCDQTVKLRVRFDGTFGSWRLKEELFEAYNLPIGKALYLNDLFVLGVDYSNIGDEAKHIDAFAVGDAAKWILENNITRGSVFEGYFKLEWKYVKNVAGKSRIQIGASDAYIAKLVLRNANIDLITQSSNTAMPNSRFSDLNITFTTTTNGTILSDEIKEWLLNHKTEFIPILSLDGNKEIHDRNRGNSFDKIDKKFFSDNWPNQGIKMTVSPNTIDDMFNSFVYLYNIGFYPNPTLAREVDWNLDILS